MFYTRRLWLRLAITLILLSCFNIQGFRNLSFYELREASISALKAIVIIFSISSAITLNMFSHYVHGIRSQMISLTGKIRNMAWQCYEENKNSTDSAVQDIITHNLLKLLQGNDKKYLSGDLQTEWENGVVERLDRMKNSEESHVLYNKYLRPIEESMRELGLLFVRSIISSVHADLIVGTFTLTAVGISAIIFGSLLPNNIFIDFTIANAAITIQIYAVLELIMLVSFIKQEAKEEEIETILGETKRSKGTNIKRKHSKKNKVNERNKKQ